jgi:hypothetical protein
VEQRTRPDALDDAAVTDVTAAGEPTLAEDLLLLLFQPDSGTIAGENILYYALAGAVLSDLALDERVTTTSERPSLAKVAVVPDAAPEDALLLATWGYVAQKPRHVQTILAATGPTLRPLVLQRLIDRGDIVEKRRTLLGVIPTTKLLQGDTGRREELLECVRAVLVDGHEPTARVAALAALVYGSGTLPHFHRVIPWNSAVISRAEELKRGNWGAGAAAQAVARTIASVIANNIVVATTLASRT